MLRWADADHRDLPPRATTAISGTTAGAGGMMQCPSSGSIRHRFLRRHRTSGDCPQPHEPAEAARFHLNPAPCALMVSENAPLRATLTLPVPADYRCNPDVGPSSPQAALSPTRLRPSEVCQRGPPPLGGRPRAAVYVEKPSGERSDGRAARRSQKPAIPATRSDAAVGSEAQNATGRLGAANQGRPAMPAEAVNRMSRCKGFLGGGQSRFPGAVSSSRSA